MPTTLRVLLVEPDHDVATLFVEAMSIRAADLAVTLVGSLQEALVALSLTPHEVALVELNLPDASGLQTVLQLRQQHPELPLVVLSTIADEDLALTAIQQGAQDYLLKEAVHYSLISRAIRYGIERKRIELELQAAKVTALAASAAKSEFLAHMSHEIRNPLTAIVNYAELVQRPETALSERESAVETIRRNALHLLEVVNDILDISKIESRTFDLERVECSPRQIIFEVLEMFQVRAQSKGLELVARWGPDVPERIINDPLRVKQIIVNLISNAVKFTERGRVCVEVERVVEAGKAVMQISVVDTGIGIPLERQAKLFVAYQQSEAWIARKFGGTGLGLAISRELALKMGGDITIASQPGVGSRFTLRLAMDTRLPKKAVEPRERIEARVLLADDSPDNRRILAMLLVKAGATVEVVENGGLAVDAALQANQAGEPYDVILMDMVMPEKDGFMATRQLRAAGYTGPIVALTANSGEGARQECLAAGCDDFALKPIDRTRLIAVVQKWIGTRRAGKSVGKPEAKDQRSERGTLTSDS